MTTIMKGFPVTPENRIPIQDWDRAPWNRWSFQHVREILPTSEVRRGATGWELSNHPVDLGAIELKSAEGQQVTIDNWLESSYTDGFIVLHKGKNVFEKYMNEMSDQTLHLSQSMSKSITGSVAGTLIGRGQLNPDEYVTHYLPELEFTGWRDATLQHVMDMTTGVRYVEDYEALDSDIALTDIASGWKPSHAGVYAPACVWDQIITLTETTRPHGTLFHYRSIETDVLAHCMERVTETKLPELISQELWQPLGCEQNACFTVDSAGYALACGGFNATLRDYARFGQLHIQKGFANGQQIIPEAWIKDIQNGSPELFDVPYTETAPNGAYRNQFWIENVDRKAYMARGVFGQLIYIDPENEMVVVKLSSWPEFISIPRLKTTLNAIHSIARFLTVG